MIRSFPTIRIFRSREENTRASGSLLARYLFDA
ncbi:hypothetical protein PS9374_02491 [Planomonospora sphaerica]|uniref:Uncharacterized protein n=1 Tax=Planomonospora sphaerica TaxID=161355 RepID=A0A171CKC5_9ACTN|nr:hypothetical protein PS9374_02491 [Planomonospora sphaerica]